jgi:hypothetical protein
MYGSSPRAYRISKPKRKCVPVASEAVFMVCSSVDDKTWPSAQVALRLMMNSRKRPTNRSFCACAMAVALATPCVADAQSAGAFDGVYQGVSNTATGSGPNCSVFNAFPRPLTIRNNVAQFDGGLKGTTTFQGYVTTQGVLTMRDHLANRAAGKVEPNGRATAAITLGGGNCVLSAIWQRQ